MTPHDDEITIQGTQKPDMIPQGTDENPWEAGAELRRSMNAAEKQNNAISKDESNREEETVDPLDSLHRTFEEIARRLDDPARLNSVRSTLAKPVPPLVDVLIRALAADLDCAFAAVTIIDDTHQHFLSTNMGKMESCERDASKCQFVIGTGHMVAINNVKSTGMWRWIIQGLTPGSNDPLQAYLGVPLKNSDGQILGAVCVVDDKPRVWTAKEHYALYETSKLVTSILAEAEQK